MEDFHNKRSTRAERSLGNFPLRFLPKGYPNKACLYNLTEMRQEKGFDPLIFVQNPVDTPVKIAPTSCKTSSLGRGLTIYDSQTGGLNFIHVDQLFISPVKLPQTGLSSA